MSALSCPVRGASLLSLPLHLRGGDSFVGGNNDGCSGSGWVVSNSLVEGGLVAAPYSPSSFKLTASEPLDDAKDLFLRLKRDVRWCYQLWFLL